MSEHTEVSIYGLTHRCADLDCHVPGFVRTLREREAVSILCATPSGCTCGAPASTPATSDSPEVSHAPDAPLTEAEIEATALFEAADAIQALHPGETKNSVTFLRDRAHKILAARTSTATADDGLRERVEALADEWERTSPAWLDPVGGPVHELRAILDATAAPTTDTGARDE